MKRLIGTRLVIILGVGAVSRQNRSNEVSGEGQRQPMTAGGTTVNKIPFTIFFLLLTSAACFGQSSYKGLTPKSTRSAVERVLGKPVNKVSALDTATFKDVCQKIGIFGADGKPNDQYMAFVSQHVDWGVKSEASQFRQEINSKAKAKEYIREHLSDQ